MATRRNRKIKRGPVDLADLRVGLYCRVSLDKDDTGKSTADQEQVGRDWVASVGAVVTDTYVEEGSRSASRFATKEREQFKRLMADIRAGKLDVVWFWELSRSQRRLDVYADLRDTCRDAGVLLVIRDKVYDPSDYKDMLTPGILSLMGEGESEQTSERVERGKASSARAGRRAGQVPYGYRAVYDRDGNYLYDEPNQYDEQGQPTKDSPAAIVREIYMRILAGHSMNSIRLDLDRRGVRTARGCKWSCHTILRIASNPTYLGKRVYQAYDARPVDRVKSVLDDVETTWPALVDHETWWAVHRILSSHERKTKRPGRAVHLLSNVCRCAVCGSGMSRKPGDTVTYSCRDRVCVGIDAVDLDDYVEEVMIRWLSDPDAMAELTRVDDSAAAAQARGDAEQLRAQLAELYQDAAAGRVSPTIATTTEKGLLSRIDEAEQRIQAATLPPVLRGNIGAQAAAGWAALDVEVKRQIIQAVAEIRIHPVGRRAGAHQVPVGLRVEWRWLLGSLAAQEVPDNAVAIEEYFAARRSRFADRQATVARMKDAGLTRQEIADEIGVSVHTVKKIIGTIPRNVANA